MNFTNKQAATQVSIASPNNVEDVTWLTRCRVQGEVRDTRVGDEDKDRSVKRDDTNVPSGESNNTSSNNNDNNNSSSNKNKGRGVQVSE